MSFTEGEKQVFRDAAEYIAENGHTKGVYFGGETRSQAVVKDDLNPPACLLGAIAKVTGEHPEQVRMAYADRLARQIGVTSEGGFRLGIQHWNDAPDITAEDVILKLKEWGNS
jgi:hypothetical protein